MLREEQIEDKLQSDSDSHLEVTSENEPFIELTEEELAAFTLLEELRGFYGKMSDRDLMMLVLHNQNVLGNTIGGFIQQAQAFTGGMSKVDMLKMLRGKG